MGGGAEIGATLRATTRDTDVVARYGGDEFVILLPHAGLEQAEIAGKRLLDRVRAVGLRHGGDPPVTASIGIAVAGPADDPTSLVERADASTYAAKRAGGDRIVGAC